MKKRKDLPIIISFLAPALLVFSVFIFLPVIKTLYLSFYDWNMLGANKNFVGFKNYSEILSILGISKSFINTIIYIILLLIFNFVLPYILAYVLGILVNKFQGIYRSLIFFPSIISLVVGTLVFLWILNPLSGPIAYLYKLFGSSSPFWFKTNGLVIVTLSLITSWKMFGYNLILLLAGIFEVPLELLESAKIDNLTNWQIFKNIVIPMTSSTSLYVMVVTIVYGLQQIFIPINVVTQGGPNNGSTNLIYSIYQYAFTFFQTGRSSAIAIVTTLLFFIIISIKINILEKGVYYEN